MKICRFNRDRLGLVEGNRVFDVSAALATLPPSQWPWPPGDPLLRHLPTLQQAIGRCRPGASSLPLQAVQLHSPVTAPTKLMAVPANYRLHVEQDTRDPGVDQGVHRKALEGIERPADVYGLFLKANSCLVGPAEGLALTMPDRRTDHEVELAVVISREGRSITRDQAMQHVAAYCIGLDMTLRGKEDRSFRKSPDGYAVLGPWLVTADEIPDPHALTLSLWINGELRQRSSTGAMTIDIPDLIVLASSMYTLHPGDVILTGTPEGVGPVQPGDELRAACDGIGEMTLRVRAPAHTIN